MRIALVSSGSGSRGGGELYLRFLAEGLSRTGNEVVAVVPAAERMDELAASLVDFAAVKRYAARTTYDRRTRVLGAALDRPQQRRLAALFAQLAPDVVHINQQVAEDGIDLVLAARRGAVPWVSTIHIGRSAHDLGASLGWLRDRVTAAMVRSAEGHYIAVSAASCEQLRARFGARSNLHVVLNGVPTRDPAALAAARARVRAEWGVADGDVVVGAVGRLEAQKNPLALVDRLAPLAGAARPGEGKVRLVWIGDGALRGALEARAAPFAETMPLVVDGWREDAALRMAGFDVFLLPSRYEGLPLALLEAMHAGLPVIGPRTDGVVEAVREGETGFMCAREEEWRAAAERLVRDPGLRARLGAAARADARTRFSAEAMAAATLGIYDTATLDHAGRRSTAGRQAPR